ncbi:hypothetical protein [Streptomyces sp. NPDC056632]|uniref:hypothetical protein n=1 Tax=Streptomyces sp. NPDC056632 TaxID=3345884 RepID=UPI0036B1ABDE
MEGFSASPTVSAGPLSDNGDSDGDGDGDSTRGRPSPAAPSRVAPGAVTSLASPVRSVSADCGTLSPEDGT